MHGVHCEPVIVTEMLNLSGSSFKGAVWNFPQIPLEVPLDFCILLCHVLVVPAVSYL